ncbi:YihY/virulence factor BrkB family protein [Anaerotignum lactatifermentans]|uniref:YihY/virulence factor BrkB family protein n=1 Tax=Anaerotignum lactatifermentans TaxID=160404 RepID=A0ABS2GAL7_9FIRM|nr:YihY/virulence factor BrkB family protein [Anaerotignum lactatifermentans]MBM6829973.1 YihY/virulence factor BrkB family protein [Anaerotignum lactatifermentans]MBM6878476.1 YihY/virulence factor BrkB family protein [Anaerotignum lactatifermentans]MBM6951602.1 YihY/virulence factor BrkB family protein [Anaerotignum lactatifermentans]
MDLRKTIEKQRGWKKVLLLTIQGYFTNQIGRNAASMTYYLLFALFPFLVLVTSILGLLQLPMISLDGEIARFLPDDVVTLLNLAIAHVTQTSNNTILTLGLVFTLWFPYRAVSNLMSSVAAIYGCEKGEPQGLRTAGLTLFTLILIPLMLILLLIGGRVLNIVGMFIPISEDFISGWTKLRFLPMAAGLLFLLCAIYYLSPAEKQKVEYVLPGAAVSVGVWILFSLAFSYYVDHMGRYSVIYGSIGVIIAFLVWLNCSAATMLMGAVFNQARKVARKEQTEYHQEKK